MIITTTAVAFMVSAVGLGFCGFWFFRAFQKIGGLRSGRPIGILVSAFYIGLAFHHAILALGSLFFTENPEALYATLIIAVFELALVTALGLYLVFYILLPNISPWPATIWGFLLDIILTILIITAHPLPFVNANNGIDWGLPRGLEGLLYFALLLTIGAPFVVFSKNFLHAETREVKMISFILGFVAFIGLLNVSILFAFLFIPEEVRAKIFDAILSSIGAVFIITFLLIPILTRRAVRAQRSTS